MTTLQLLIICATAIILAVLAVGVRAQPPAPPEPGVFGDLAVGDRVAAYTSSGQSIVGVVTASPNGRLLLGDAALVTGGEETKLGDVRVPREAVELVQVISRPPRDPTNPE
jgi:hypothetical protein